MANRHGLITGATGTGKTVTLQVLAERFSRIGVPTFMADVKGDLVGSRRRGCGVAEAARSGSRCIGAAEPAFAAAPVVFWDVFGAVAGIPCARRSRTWGRSCFGRLLNLNETQRGVLTLVFKIADDAGCCCSISKDLRAMLQFVGEQRQAVHDRIRQHLGGVDRRDPARRCWRSRSRAAIDSSASRCSTSTI